MHLNAGDVFQHYRVAARVGEGGMGVVYRARDTRLDRDVALKFMTQPRAGAGDG
jgi:serine/threonine-protein kinase